MTDPAFYGGVVLGVTLTLPILFWFGQRRFDDGRRLGKAEGWNERSVDVDAWMTQSFRLQKELEETKHVTVNPRNVTPLRVVGDNDVVGSHAIVPATTQQPLSQKELEARMVAAGAVVFLKWLLTPPRR